MPVELFVFLLTSVVVLLSSAMVIKAREIFHSALFLALMLVGVGVLFIMLKAPFIAAIHILIYVGGVVILVLFAILLTKREGR